MALGLAAGAAELPRLKSASAQPASTNDTSVVTLAGGCFWCVDAIYRQIDGVVSVVSGYTGGRKENPTYKEVCTGLTGHAEAVQIRFDPKRVTCEQIFEAFWLAHDPTTLNQQGGDVGTQYRSAIFYHDAAQHAAAEKSKAKAAQRFTRPIVTQLVPFTKFYPAEDYHQDYFRLNGNAPYCQAVIRPKLEKFTHKLSE